ncbi:MAG: AI-2E family transporter, partial [Floccifex sp.]
MFKEDEGLFKISKWIIATFTCCILIYLGIKYFQDIVHFISILFGYAFPLVLGLIFALILNVPMSFFERQISKKMKKGIRPVSIVCSIVLVLGIFVGVFVLV